MPGAERHHSHVMPGGIKHGPALAEAAQRGLPPPVMPPHYHTEAGFPTGLVFVLTERDEWYEVLGSAIVQAYEYCQRNGTCLELVSAGAVCLATGGIGCAPLAGAVARNVAIILVEEEVVPVPAGGREAALNFVRTVGQ